MAVICAPADEVSVTSVYGGMMHLPCFVAWMLLASAMITGAGVVSGQTFPSKPVRIVTGSVGGNSDFSARLVAQGISGPLGQPVIIDNRGGGIVPGLTVAKSAPDGYTLLVAAGTLWNGPLLRETPYDPLKDFLPISLMNRSPAMLVVHPSLPVKLVKEFIALAKARPGELNFSSSSIGSISHLAGELFKYMAKINVVRVNYKISANEMTDLVSGYIQFSVGTAGELMPYVKAGQLRALAVTGPQRSPLMTGLPTVAATLPGFEALSMTGIFAPAKTPAPVINRLSQEIMRFVRTPEAKERFLESGVEAVGSTPEELASAMNAEIARWSKLIKAVGIKVD